MPAATSPSKVSPSNNSAATTERYASCGSMSMTNTVLRTRIVPPYTLFHPANDDEDLRDAGEGGWVDKEWSIRRARGVRITSVAENLGLDREQSCKVH